MLHLLWRHEQTDLYGQYSTYSEHFQAIHHNLAEKISEYKPFAAEINQAQEMLETADAQQQWDLLAPGV